ncbi:MAG: iron ABC transporter permease [Firmicutes bacterium]|nr:iron ABC transporter permease [Bacillota bacterium]
MKKKQKQALEPKIQLHIKEEERNVFADEHRARWHMDHRSFVMWAMAAGVVIVYLLVIFLPNGLDSNNVNLSAAWWAETLRGNIEDFSRMLSADSPDYMDLVVCRFAAVSLVGAALASSGAVYQGALRNGLASPTTLGVQTGGVLGGTVYVVFFMVDNTSGKDYAQIIAQRQAMNLLQRYEEAFFIIGGALLAVAFVVTVARIAGRGKISSLALILTGMMFSGTVGGAIGLVRYWLMLTDTYGTKTYELRFMMMGTFSRVYTPEHLLLVGAPVAVGLLIIMLMRNRLNLLVFGEDEARIMGLRVDLTRNVMVAVVTILTAIVIAFCGMIGFIGFIVPHMARRITGPDFRWLLPGSAMLGAITMLVIYYIATAVNYADNINFMTSLIGGTGFLIMMIRARRKSNADWA